MPQISILGAGPAGSSAAIAARREDAEVHIYEKSHFPRHKVCGEFLSPELAEVLSELNVWQDVETLHPPRIHRVSLHLGKRRKNWHLPDPAYGLSRYALDDLLLRRARANGATVHRESKLAADPPAIIAHGRRASSPGTDRLFGFKAHFHGPADDCVHLFFFHGCYVGVSPVEGGRTNVCGLAPESLLKSHNFEVDELLPRSPALEDRLTPLTRAWDWLMTGPLIYRSALHEPAQPGIYPAGDALGFVDPFTGSGILSAINTGRIAGLSAARSISAEGYLLECKELLGFQYRAAVLFRTAIASGIAEAILPLLPGQALFRLTRPTDIKKSR
jgi:flavin-dependent dehydrogenase